MRCELDWDPPEDWHRIRTIDAHTEGEPLRVITTGIPEVAGETMPAKRRWAEERLEPVRTALMWEPRGHTDMYGCIPTPPVREGADLGVLFLHNEGFSTMCGHGIIALATVLLETGMLPASEPETVLKIDTPAGPVRADARVEGKRVRSVRFRNVPAFVVALDETVEVERLGRVRYDLAFGGAFYAYVEAASVGLRCEPGQVGPLIEAARSIKRAVAATRPVEHPLEPDLGFLYGVVFVGPAEQRGHHSRNVCIFAEGEVDRCPTGTSVSARLALQHARGELDPGDPIVIESILGTTFTGRILETTTFGPHAAVVPEVEGTARITGRHEFLIDPEDPLRRGFLVR